MPNAFALALDRRMDREIALDPQRIVYRRPQAPRDHLAVERADKPIINTSVGRDATPVQLRIQRALAAPPSTVRPSIGTVYSTPPVPLQSPTWRARKDGSRLTHTPTATVERPKLSSLVPVRATP